MLYYHIENMKKCKFYLTMDVPQPLVFLDLLMFKGWWKRRVAGKSHALSLHLLFFLIFKGKRKKEIPFFQCSILFFSYLRFLFIFETFHYHLRWNIRIWIKLSFLPCLFFCMRNKFSLHLVKESQYQKQPYTHVL